MNQSTSTSFNNPSTLSSTLWLPLGALASVYGLVTLSWMVYRVHLPALLASVNLAEGLAPTILLIEAVLAIALEPIVGAVADRLSRQRGTSLPLIVTGVALSVVLFIAIPLVAKTGTATGWAQTILLAVLVLWAIAISLFRSPAVALLRQYAPSARLPQAASALTFAGAIAASAAPFATAAVKAMDTLLVFALVAGLLTVATLGLRQFHRSTVAGSKPAVDEATERHTPDTPFSVIAFVSLFGLGLATTLSLRLVVETWPKILRTQVPEVTPSLLVGWMFVVMAIAAFPVGRLAVRYGNRQVLQWGTLLVAVLLGLMPAAQSAGLAVLLGLGLGIGFSGLTNGTLPLVIRRSARHTALGMGAFFGGAAAATSLYLGAIAKAEWSITGSILLGLAALGLLVLSASAGEDER